MEIAPELEIAHWLNTDTPIMLNALRGRVVLIEAFQLLCPGCVSQGLPQAKNVFETFSRNDVVVIGLHCVFEHHAAQGGRDILAAFLHENRIRFPVGIDMPSIDEAIPKTMARYHLQGTPTMILIDKQGRIRRQHFGKVSDMALGAELMTLVLEQS